MKNNNIFLKKVIFILSNLGIKESFKVIMKNIFSYNHYYILNANLKSIKLFQKTRIKYSLKKIEENEISEIREMLPSLSPKDRKEILIRLSFYNSGFKNCYIARSKKGKIAYIQWIIYPHENEMIEIFS